MTEMRQMPLSLKPPRRPSFDNFIVGQNQSVVATLQHGLIPGEWYLLMGPTGSGSSHLLAACFQSLVQQEEDVAYLRLSDLKHWALLDSLTSPWIVIDDVDHLAGNDDGERSLFNALNRWRLARSTVIMSAVSLAGIELPDLGSRLGQSTRLTLKPLDESDLKTLVCRLAQDQDMQMPEEVANYLVSRTKRNASELSELMTQLMQQALSERRAITIPMVRALLA